MLAKLEQRRAVAVDPGPWPGESRLQRLTDKLGVLRRQWRDDELSDTAFFTNQAEIEEEIRAFTRDRSRHELAARRAAVDLADVRRRWEDDELDLSQKRAYIQEALHAVIVHPAGRGRGRGQSFDPDLLELIWLE